MTPAINGKGFAVVADEVRKLAEKTMSATQEVNNSISAIQQSVHTNIESVGAKGNKVKPDMEDAKALAAGQGRTVEDLGQNAWRRLRQGPASPGQANGQRGSCRQSGVLTLMRQKAQEWRKNSSCQYVIAKQNFIDAAESVDITNEVIALMNKETPKFAELPTVKVLEPMAKPEPARRVAPSQNPKDKPQPKR